MDTDPFAKQLSFLTHRPSRRGVAHAMAGIGLSGLLTTRIALNDAEAKKKGKKRKKKKKCPKVSCNDTIKNGDESDIDCGGGCNRCSLGQACRSRDDCLSAFCDSGTCGVCAGPADCGTDANGECSCYSSMGTPFRCASNAPPVMTGVDSCDECPPNLQCRLVGVLSCVLPCGAA